MPSRHASNSSPLSIGGRMFVQGENVVMAYDAYNGLKLWERKIPGALRVGLKTGCSNLAANADSLFVAVGSDCLRLDAATGKTTKTYRTPAGKDGRRRTWYYLACVGGALYGSSGDWVFAVDLASGKVKWTYAAKSLMAATICVGDARVFFGPGEEALAKGVVEASSGAARAADDLDLWAVTRGLARCAVAVGGDTGLLHLAAAAGARPLGLFGPTGVHMGYWPWDGLGAAIAPDLDCHPCTLYGSETCPLEHHACLAELEVERVVRGACELLEDGR